MRSAAARSHPTATMTLVAMALVACGSEPAPVSEEAPSPPVRELVERYIEGASDAPGWSEAHSRMSELDMEDALDRILVRKTFERRLSERPDGVVSAVDEVRETSQAIGAQVPWRTLLERIESCAGQACAGDARAWVDDMLQEHSDGYWLHVARFQLWPRDDLAGRLQAISVLPCHSPAFVIRVTETKTYTTLTEGPFAASSEEALMTYALLQGEIQADYRAQGVAMPEVPDCETGTAAVKR